MAPAHNPFTQLWATKEKNIGVRKNPFIKESAFDQVQRNQVDPNQTIFGLPQCFCPQCTSEAIPVTCTIWLMNGLTQSYQRDTFTETEILQSHIIHLVFCCGILHWSFTILQPSSMSETDVANPYFNIQCVHYRASLRCSGLQKGQFEITMQDSLPDKDRSRSLGHYYI